MSDRAYEAYHEKVADECARLMGEHTRPFFAARCDFSEQFRKGADPAEVARAQQAQYGGGDQ